MIIELLAYTPEPEKLIEQAGRTCYLSHDKITPESAGIFIRGAIKRGHESILEHASATFRISEVSRALSHQLVRHRLASYSQQSQRYVKEDQFGYTIPESISNNECFKAYFHNHMLETQKLYDHFVVNGINPEDARSILPNACHTEMVMTANFREWRGILKLRCEKHAQREIRILCKNIGQKLLDIAPNVFSDLEGLIYEEL